MTHALFVTYNGRSTFYFFCFRFPAVSCKSLAGGIAQLLKINYMTYETKNLGYEIRN